MAEIPDDVAAELDFDSNRTVQDEHIVKAVTEAETPFVPRRTVEDAVGLSSEQTRKRLNELEERGVLNSAVVGGSRLYWLNRPESRWPIPPDVEVAPVTEELTVREVIQRDSVLYALFGIVLLLVGGLGLTVFTTLFAYEVTVPLVSRSAILTASILAAFGALAVLAGAAAMELYLRVQQA